LKGYEQGKSTDGWTVKLCRQASRMSFPSHYYEDPTMTQITSHCLISPEAENELVNKIHYEIEERHQFAEFIEHQPTDIPGDSLVQLAGELSLCTSPNGLIIYARELWPRIRACFQYPNDLITGTYEPAISRTHGLLGKPTASSSEEPFRLAAALTLPPGKKEDDLLYALANGQWDVSATDSLASLFIMRLDAGFFLSGIETLWAQTAANVNRILYTRCGLEDWDKVLGQYKPVLNTHAASLRQRLTSNPARLDTTYFKILMDLARCDNHPQLTLVSTGTAEPLKGSAVRPWQWYAVDDFFKLLFPDDMESGTISVTYDENALCLQVRFTDNNIYQVIFSDESQDSVDIQFSEESKRSDRFQGFYLFDTVSRQIGLDKDDEETMLIQFIGRVSKESVLEKESDLTSGNAIIVDKSRAIPAFT